jgi:hypothetical protein
VLIAIQNPTGMMPKYAAHLLPDNAASYARNVDVRNGTLKGIRAPAKTEDIENVAGSAKSIFTLDGTRYFTWPVTAHASRAPTIGDINERIYYADTTSGPRVTQRNQMSVNGGAPSLNWRVGVPIPKISSSSVDNMATLPDNLALVARFWYEADGVRYQEQSISLTQIVLGREYSFTLPTRDAAPQGASLSVTITDYFSGFWVNVGTLTDKKVATVVSATQIQLPNGEIVTASAVSDDLQVTSTSVSSIWSASQTPANKTPAAAKPTISIDAQKNGKSEFICYSENSVSVRADQPAKVTLKEGASASVMNAVIEWGGSGSFSKGSSKDTSAYVVTLVNSFEEEGGPSEAVVLTRDFLQQITLQVQIPVDAAEYNGQTRIRVYKSVTGTGNDFFRVYEFSTALTANATYTLVVRPPTAAELGPTLESTTRQPPPKSARGGLTTAFGSVMWWTGNEVWFSETYRGHAYSTDYVVTLPNNVITVRPTAFGVVAWTTAGVHIINGSSPRNLLAVQLPIRQTLVNDSAISIYENMVIFASQDGLVTMRGSDARLEPFLAIMDRDQWGQMYSSRFTSLTLAAHDGYLYGMFASGDGFAIRFEEQGGIFVEHSINAIGAAYFPQTDELLLGTSNGLEKFAAGALLDWVWQSKEFRVGKPVNMGAFQCVGSGVISYIIGIDAGSLSPENMNLSSIGTTHRLPALQKGQHWRVVLASSGSGDSVNSFRLCGVPRELSGA